MTNPSIADVLDKAADLIEPEGAWCQKSAARTAKGEDCGWDEGPTCFCAFGAIYMAAGGRQPYQKAMRVVADVVGMNIVSWNDAPERTQAEVVAKLREAATLARETSHD